MDIPFFICGIILLLLSYPLYKGKGSWIIPGHDSMDEQEKAMYGENKLFTVLAVTLTFIGIILIGGAFDIFHTNEMMIYSIVVLVVGVICANTAARQ